MTDCRRNARRIGGAPKFALGCLAALAMLAPMVVPGPARAGDLLTPNSGLYPGPYLGPYAPASAQTDQDGDGVADEMDAFPLDPTESTDLDGDGVGDHADAYPLDPVRYSILDRTSFEDPVDTCPALYKTGPTTAAGSGADASCIGF